MPLPFLPSSVYRMERLACNGVTINTWMTTVTAYTFRPYRRRLHQQEKRSPLNGEGTTVKRREGCSRHE